MDLFWRYFDARAVRKDAKSYGNVIHPNMFAGGVIDESALTILIVPPPELHLLMGPVNTMYDELCKTWAGCEEWIKRLHIKREEYHVGSFNGNDCRKLLKNINILEQIAPSPSVKIKAFIDAFKAFNDVVTSCYSIVRKIITGLEASSLIRCEVTFF